MSHTKIMKDLNNKTKEELLKKLLKIQKELMSEKARMISGAGGENTAFIRNCKKNIARIKFILKNKYGYNI